MSAHLEPILNFEDRYTLGTLRLIEALNDDLISPEIITEDNLYGFALATVGMTASEIELIISQVGEVHQKHIAELKRIANLVDLYLYGRGQPVSPQDWRFWYQHRGETRYPGWEQTLPNWKSLMKSVVVFRFGEGNASAGPNDKISYHDLLENPGLL